MNAEDGGYQSPSYGLDSTPVAMGETLKSGRKNIQYQANNLRGP
jgi:hypothetical protein